MELKANMLQLGDWVSLNGELARVSSLRDNGAGGEIGFADGTFVFAHEAEPVPVTHAVLTALGWFPDMYSRLRIDKQKWFEYYHFESRLVLWWQGVDEWQNHAELKEQIFKTHCTYLHQLQQALRSQGYYEQADGTDLAGRKFEK